MQILPPQQPEADTQRRTVDLHVHLEDAQGNGSDAVSVQCVSGQELSELLQKEYKRVPWYRRRHDMHRLCVEKQGGQILLRTAERFENVRPQNGGI